MIRPWGASALALVMLFACAPTGSVKEGPVPAGETSQAGAPTVPAPGANWPAPAASALAPAAPAPAASEAPPMPRRRPETISELTLADADPKRLVGLDFDATKALLGDPAITLERPPAKVWTYNGAVCVFNLFFYPGVDDEVFRVLAYEVTDEASPSEIPTQRNAEPGARKAQDKDDPIVRRCFAELLNSRPAPDAG